MPRDTEKQRTYNVEDQFMKVMDRQHECPSFTIAGSTVVLPAEHKFADIASIQRYVDMIVPDAGLKVRPRKGQNRAHYFAGVREIAVPVLRTLDGHTPWAMRAYVVLHEIAHSLTPRHVPAHGKEFRQTVVDLTGKYIGPEAGFVLSVMFSEEGL